MEDFIHNNISKRFAEVYGVLLMRGEFYSQRDLSTKIGTYPHIIRDVLKGKRNLTSKQIEKLAECTSINSEWLLTGKGKRFDINKVKIEGNEVNFNLGDFDSSESENTQNKYKTEIEVLKKEVEGLKREIEVKNTLIKSKDDFIKFLKTPQ